MHELIKQIKEFNEARDWDKFHSPENLAKYKIGEGKCRIKEHYEKYYTL